MTEPPPGAGSDPAQLATTARSSGRGWLIEGRKWFATGADGAAFAIVMARTGGTVGAPEATMFLIPAETPGFRLTRHVPALDSAFVGGHGEIELTDCHVGDDAVLGQAGKGFAYAQVRLAPARLTHCMRWIGLARRAHAIAPRLGARELAGLAVEQRLQGISQGSFGVIVEKVGEAASFCTHLGRSFQATSLSVRGSGGSPRTRSATMLRRTSDVPPSIELPLARR